MITQPPLPFISAVLPLLLVAILIPACASANPTSSVIPTVAELNKQATALHRERRLKEASALYVQVLELDPPRRPTEEGRALALRYAPRLFIIAQKALTRVTIAGVRG